MFRQWSRTWWCLWSSHREERTTPAPQSSSQRKGGYDLVFIFCSLNRTDIYLLPAPSFLPGTTAFLLPPWISPPCILLSWWLTICATPRCCRKALQTNTGENLTDTCRKRFDIFIFQCAWLKPDFLFYFPKPCCRGLYQNSHRGFVCEERSEERATARDPGEPSVCQEKVWKMNFKRDTTY